MESKRVSPSFLGWVRTEFSLFVFSQSNPSRIPNKTTRRVCEQETGCYETIQRERGVGRKRGAKWEQSVISSDRSARGTHRRRRCEIVERKDGRKDGCKDGRERGEGRNEPTRDASIVHRKQVIWPIEFHSSIFTCSHGFIQTFLVLVSSHPCSYQVNLERIRRQSYLHRGGQTFGAFTPDDWGSWGVGNISQQQQTIWYQKINMCEANNNYSKLGGGNFNRLNTRAMVHVTTI